MRLGISGYSAKKSHLLPRPVTSRAKPILSLAIRSECPVLLTFSSCARISCLISSVPFRLHLFFSVFLFFFLLPLIPAGFFNSPFALRVYFICNICAYVNMHLSTHTHSHPFPTYTSSPQTRPFPNHTPTANPRKTHTPPPHTHPTATPFPKHTALYVCILFATVLMFQGVKVVQGAVQEVATADGRAQAARDNLAAIRQQLANKQRIRCRVTVTASEITSERIWGRGQVKTTSYFTLRQCK
jgi:hypothetical protein